MQIDVSRDVFRLAQVFTISRGSRTEAKVLTVRLTDGVHQGWGECVPYARYDETLESVEAEIRGLPDTFTRQSLMDLLPAGAARIGRLDEENFIAAVTRPAAFAADCGSLGDASELELGAYAVLRIELAPS